MRPKIYALAAGALLLGATSAPAGAQSLGTVLDILTEGSSAIQHSSYNPCSYHNGLEKVTCQVRQARFKAKQVDTMSRRVQSERKEAQQRRAAVSGKADAQSYPPIVLQNCVWGVASACDSLRLTPAQAKKIMNQDSTLTIGR